MILETRLKISRHLGYIFEVEIVLHKGGRRGGYKTPGAHWTAPPSPLISWVNPFPSRFINRANFFCNALESHECACCLLFDVKQYYCHFSIFIGSFLCQRAKPRQGTVLFINLLGKGLTPRDFMGDGGSIWWNPEDPCYKKKVTKSLLTAKVRIYKREAFKLPLVHGLEQVFVCGCKLRHLHREIRIKVFGVVTRRLRKKRRDINDVWGRNNCPIQLHNEIQDALHRRHKVSLSEIYL